MEKNIFLPLSSSSNEWSKPNLREYLQAATITAVCRQLGSRKQDLPSWRKLSLQVIYIQICRNSSENFFLKMRATQFSPGMKLQTLGLGNPEIVAVRKHFNTREIVLFLLFFLHVTYTEEENNERKTKPPASMHLMLLLQERYISGRIFLPLLQGWATCCCAHALLAAAVTAISCFACLTH